jgi:hypothetical protein
MNAAQQWEIKTLTSRSYEKVEDASKFIGAVIQLTNTRSMTVAAVVRTLFPNKTVKFKILLTGKNGEQCECLVTQVIDGDLLVDRKTASFWKGSVTPQLDTAIHPRHLKTSIKLYA